MFCCGTGVVTFAPPVHRVEAFGETKVAQNAVTCARVEEKVGRFDVSMDDVDGVGSSESVEEAAKVVADAVHIDVAVEVLV